MESINLIIPNMKSQHCMMVVKATVQNHHGASLKKIVSGEVEIELSVATKASVVQAIEKAGYTVVNQ